MSRIIVDLEPLYRLYDGGDVQRALLKQAIALEIAGADGVFVYTGPFSQARAKTLANLKANLGITLTVRVESDQEWIETLLDIKPSMVVFGLDGSDQDNLKENIIRVQVANILAAVEIPLDINSVKQAARLKADYLMLDCQRYCAVESLNEEIEELNLISKLASLGVKLAMGTAAKGDFSRPKLRKLAQMRTIEEYFVGLPLLSESLVRGYTDTLQDIKAVADQSRH